MATKKQPSAAEQLTTESLSWLGKGSSALKASLGAVEKAAYVAAATADAALDLAERGAKYSHQQSAKSFNMSDAEWKAYKAQRRAEYLN